MPDLDEDLAELRESLRASVRQPELDTVIERSRQQTARRRTQLGAVAAVLIVAAAIPVLRTTLQPAADDPAAPPATETSTSSMPLGPFVYDVDFADARHGFALRAGCADLDANDCRHELLVTEDGEHWQGRTLPVELRDGDLRRAIRLFVFGPRSAALALAGATERLSFATSDAGLTWVRAPSDASTTITAIPDGGLLTADCVVPPPAECTFAAFAVDPGTGRELMLTTPPPLVEPFPASDRPVAGGWWVGGRDPATGVHQLAVSRDAGQSWSIRPLPGATGKGRGTTMVARGATLYVATEIAGQPAVGNEFLAIFRSVDGGASWEQTFRSEDKGEPRSIAGYLVVTADGRLIVPAETGGVWVSTDGGRNFTVDPNPEFAGFVKKTRAGYLASTSVSSWSSVDNVYKLSTDGVRWKEIRVG